MGKEQDFEKDKGGEGSDRDGPSTEHEYYFSKSFSASEKKQ
jgi:hypothetical protein